MSMMKKLAKTSDKVVWSTQVSRNVVAVPEIPRERRLIRNAARVSEMPKPTRRYIRTTNRTIATAKASRGLKKLTVEYFHQLETEYLSRQLQKVNPHAFRIGQWGRAVRALTGLTKSLFVDYDHQSCSDEQWQNEP